MSNPVTDLLIELSENPARLREFRRHPERVATEEGLDATARAVLASRDAAAIRRYVAGRMGGLKPIFVQSTVAHLELGSGA